MAATAQLPLRLPDDLYIALKAASTFTERSMNDIAVEALTVYLTDRQRRSDVDAAADRVRVRYRAALDRLGE